MATYTTSAAVGEREDLSDIIYRIDPTETPLVTAMAKETTSGVTTEWQVQELAAPSLPTPSTFPPFSSRPLTVDPVHPATWSPGRPS